MLETINHTQTEILQQDIWYAIRTMARAEKKVEQRLIDKKIEVFLPQIEVVKVWSDRRKKVKVPLLPGYIFVKMNETVLNEIFYIQGIVDFVKFLGKPAKVHGYELENIRILSTNPAEYQAINNIDLKEGEDITIDYGPFAGLTGKFVKSKGKFRIIVQIQALGKQFEVNVPTAYLKLD